MHASRLPHVFSALESPPHAACVQHSSKRIPTAWKPNACLQIEFPAMSFPRGARVQWPVVQFRKLILSPCVSVVILIAYPPSKWLDGMAWHYLGIFPRPSPHVVYSPLRVHGARIHASERASMRSTGLRCGGSVEPTTIVISPDSAIDDGRCDRRWNVHLACMALAASPKQGQIR